MKSLLTTLFIVFCIVIILTSVIFYYAFKVRISMLIREKFEWNKDINLLSYLLLAKCKNVTFSEILAKSYVESKLPQEYSDCLNMLVKDSCVSIKLGLWEIARNCQKFKPSLEEKIPLLVYLFGIGNRPPTYLVWRTLTIRAGK